MIVLKVYCTLCCWIQNKGIQLSQLGQYIQSRSVKTISKYKLVFLEYIVSEAAHINTFGIKQ